jgi:hypothetical protein
MFARMSFALGGVNPARDPVGEAAQPVDAARPAARRR